MAGRTLDVASLISKCIPLQQAPEAYQLLLADRSLLGVQLSYTESGVDLSRTIDVGGGRSKTGGQKSESASQLSIIAQRPVVGVIGAGSFASLVLLPGLAKTSARLKVIASAGGSSAARAARKFRFEQATSDYQVIIDDQEVNTVFIATRHDSHARMVVAALRAGKHVFVEKPLALDPEHLAAVREAFEQADGCQLMVGFNRRFSPLSIKMWSLLTTRSQPLSLVYTVNAGSIPAGHWTQDLKVGGGRIIGEGCHFVDLLRFLVGVPIVGVEARMIGNAPGGMVQQDKMTIVLEFADGSLGTVHYFANGSKLFPKERVEVFSEGRVLVLDNFQSLTGYGWRGLGPTRLWRQDKGHSAEIAAFVRCIAEGGASMIPFAELEEVTAATFAATERAMERPRPIPTVVQYSSAVVAE